jgi:plasmid stabilization system protein ParE
LDLAEELNWLNDKAGPEVAEKWYQSLAKTLSLLQAHPWSGRTRRDLLPQSLRSWRVDQFPRWLIFYGVEADRTVVLCRLRQGTMNLVVLKMRS